MKTKSLYIKSRFFPKFLRFNLQKTVFFELLILIGLLFSFLFRIGLLTNNFFLQKKYENEIKEISKKIEVLQIVLAKESSFSQLEKYISKEDFVKINPGEIKYFQAVEDTLVRNK